MTQLQVGGVPGNLAGALEGVALPLRDASYHSPGPASSEPVAGYLSLMPRTAFGVAKVPPDTLCWPLLRVAP